MGNHDDLSDDELTTPEKIFPLLPIILDSEYCSNKLNNTTVQTSLLLWWYIRLNGRGMWRAQDKPPTSGPLLAKHTTCAVQTCTTYACANGKPVIICSETEDGVWINCCYQKWIHYLPQLVYTGQPTSNNDYQPYLVQPCLCYYLGPLLWLERTCRTCPLQRTHLAGGLWRQGPGQHH